MNSLDIKQKTHQQDDLFVSKSPSSGPAGAAIAPPAYGIDTIDKSYASMPLEEAIKNLPKMTTDQALVVLKKYQQSIIRSITRGEERIRELTGLHAESFTNYLIGSTIDIFGLTSLPSDDWDEPWFYIKTAYTTIHNKQVKESLDLLIAASDATLRQWDQLNKYLERTDKGADRSIATLRAVRDVSFVVVGALGTVVTGGALGGALIGTGVTTLGQVAEQGTSVSIGIKKEIDWGGIAFDAVLGFALSLLGGKIAQRLAGGSGAARLAAQNPAVSQFVSSIGKQFSETAWKEIVKRAVVNVIFGRAQSVVHGSASLLFERLRNKNAKVTGGKFVDLLAEQLLSPRSYFMDILGGEIGVLAHGYLEGAGKGTVAPSETTSTSKAAETTLPTDLIESKKPAQHPDTSVSDKAPTGGASSLVTDKPVPTESSVVEPSTDASTQVAQPAEVSVEPAGVGQEPDPSFDLHIGKKRAEQIRSGEKDFAIDRALTFDIDEVLPVGASDIKPQRAVERALDPYNRQLLDPNTNQRTKGLGIDFRELRQNRGEHEPVSLKDNPNALFTRRFSEVYELKRIFDRAVSSINEPQRLTATELKAAINKETRRIIAEDPGVDAVAVRKALSILGFEYVPGRGFAAVQKP